MVSATNLPMNYLRKPAHRPFSHGRSVPLFWVVLRAFALVIVIGICGMTGFFSLAVRLSGGTMSPSPRAEGPRMEYAYVDTLADYYIAHGHSWDGINQHLRNLALNDPFHFPITVVLDTRGRVVASRDEQWPVGEVVDASIRRQGIPVRIEHEQVGIALVWESVGPGSTRRAPPPFFWNILKGLLIAGFALTLLLLVLAVLFARRISHPLRNLTVAAQTVASGQLDVQVPGASIRELHDLAAAFNTMARALAASDQQRRQMTADVAHELRTPLSVIKGRLEGLQDGVYQSTPEQIGRLLDETALLERLIDDLRLLALAEAGQLQLYPELVDPCALLEDTAATFAEQSAAQQINLHIDIPADLPLINVDSQRITQVLANLVTNALRYTPVGGNITLSGYLEQQVSGQDTAQVVLRVHNTGQGIAPEDLPHIFDRFWRADRARARSSGGSGLGLAIARQIVMAHHGTITADSTPGQGTTITIRLPRVDECTSA